MSNNINDRVEKLKGSFIDYDSNLSKKLVDLVDLRFAVQRIRIYSKHYSKFYAIERLIANNKENGPISFNDHEAIGMHCIAHTLVMLYSLCFDRNSKAKSYHLSEKIYKGFSELKDRHKMIMNLRNKYLAHDDNFFGIKVKMKIGINSEGYIESITENPKIDVVGFPDVEFEMLEPMIEIMEQFITEKEKETTELIIDRDIEILTKGKEKFIIKLENKLSINQKDLDRWSK